MCKEGHLIAAATNTPMNPEESWYTHGPSLSRILEREKGRAILIPSHPLFKGSLPVNLLLSAIREPSGTNLGIQEGDLRKYSEYWDALEAWSLSMSMEQSAKVSALAGELKKPTVSNSDSTIENAFTSHNLFRFLDFSSPEDLRQSIRDGLSRENDNACVEIRGQPKQGLKDKVFHILGNIIQNRRYF